MTHCILNNKKSRQKTNTSSNFVFSTILFSSSFLQAVFQILIHFIRIRNQLFRLKNDPDPIRTQSFDNQKLKKCTSKKFCIFFKNYHLLVPRPLGTPSRLQKTPSAPKREHPALQNMKFLISFPLWVIFAFLDPDTDRLTWLNPDPNTAYRYRTYCDKKTLNCPEC